MAFIAGPSRLKPDTGQEFAESSAISVLVAAAGRVLGCEHVGGPLMDGGHDLHQEVAPRRALHIQQPAPSAPARGKTQLLGRTLMAHAPASQNAQPGGRRSWHLRQGPYPSDWQPGRSVSYGAWGWPVIWPVTSPSSARNRGS